MDPQQHLWPSSPINCDAGKIKRTAKGRNNEPFEFHAFHLAWEASASPTASSFFMFRCIGCLRLWIALQVGCFSSKPDLEAASSLSKALNNSSRSSISPSSCSFSLLMSCCSFPFSQSRWSPSPTKLCWFAVETSVDFEQAARSLLSPSIQPFFLHCLSAAAIEPVRIV